MKISLYTTTSPDDWKFLYIKSNIKYLECTKSWNDDKNVAKNQ